MTTPPITPSTYRYTWTVDGKVQSEATAAIQLLPSELMMGQHDVALAVEDTTAMLRTDLNGVLKDSFDWTGSVTKSDCATAVGGAGGAAPSGSAGAANGGVGGSMTNGGVAGGGATSGGTAFDGAAGAAGAAAAATGGTGGVAAAGGARGVQGSPTPPLHDPSGCGCSVPGRTGEPQALVMAVAGLAVAFGRRRRLRR